MKKIIVLLVLSFSLMAQSQDQIVSEGKYSIQNVTFNSKYSDFGTTFSEKGLIFASERDTGFSVKRRHKIKDELRPFLQLFEFDGNGNVSRMRPEVNQKYHESTAAITPDGQTMYFTRNNTDFEGELRVSEENITLLKLYKTSKDDLGNWGKGRPISFCSDNYSVAHPSLSKDGKWLYFASDMPGTLGKSDIFRAPIDGNGKLGIPENLGPNVNSESSDSFPFISESGDLYFASDRSGGIGGLDLYLAHAETNMTVVSNLGESINSPSDDFALILDEQKKSGYFSSDREEGMGSDDIYAFKEISPFITSCKQKVFGVIKDKESNELLVNASIEIKNESGDLYQILSDKNGYYELEFNCQRKSSYTILVKKEDYLEGSSILEIIGKENVERDFELAYKDEPPYEVGTDLAYKLDLIPINFGSNKWNIRPEAAIKLDKIIAYMQRFSTVKIAVNSHTDSRGSDSYNLRLSENRAKATVDYIVVKGNIDRSRITGKGYGETKLLNKKCGNGGKCTNEEHFQNRRSEFIVVEY